MQYASPLALARLGRTRAHTSRILGACLGLAVAAALSIAPAHAAPVTAVTISGGNVLADGDTNGWRFQALSNINVTALGTWDEGEDGLPAQVEVGLWTDTGTLLGSLTLGSGTTESLISGFRFADLASSIALTAGQFYRIGANPVSGSIEYREGVAVTAAEDVAYDDGFYAFGDSLTFPTRGGAFSNFPDFFGPNFRYETAAVPLPATFGLFGIALAGMALTRRKAPARG